MRSSQRLFADLTGVIEDIHSVAVEGQNRSNSSDMQRALLANIRAHTPEIARIEREIAAVLEKARP